MVDDPLAPVLQFCLSALLVLAFQKPPPSRSCSSSSSTPSIISTAYSRQIGSTPLIKLSNLSSFLPPSCAIFLKLESHNPGGTGKDRIALGMLNSVLASLEPHQHLDSIFEGTSGSTGISLATLCAPLNVECTVCVPDDQSPTKFAQIESVGGKVHVVPTSSISSPSHYVNVARRLAEERQAKLDKQGGGGVSVFMDQFNNLANFRTHFTTTGPEILQQMSDRKAPISAFVMSAGTGGTVAGVGNYLCQQQSPPPRIVLADPPGSVFHGTVTTGVAYTQEQKEATIRKHRYDTICEGIGLDRVTGNFKRHNCCDSVKVTDQQVVDMAHFVLRTEGLQIGSSTACNLVAALHEAKRGGGGNVVTVMCDQGKNHIQRLWNREFIEGKGLVWPGAQVEWEKWLETL